MAAIDFTEAYDTFVKSRQKNWAHDRTKSMGASEAFGCLRKAWFAKHRPEARDPDYKDSWGAMVRGDIIEEHFAEPAVRWFLENYYYDARLIWGGNNQQTHKAPDAPLTSTSDGLVVDADDDALALYGIPSLGGTGCFHFEIKSIDPRVNLKEEKAIHHGQTQVQMGNTRETTKYQPNYAIIVYIDASFFDDIEVYVVAYDDKQYQAAKARATSLFAIENPAEIFPEGKIDNGCEYCPYTEECTRVTRGATPSSGEATFKTMSAEELKEFEELLAESQAVSAQRKALNEAASRSSERVKEWFRKHAVRRVVTSDETKVSLAWVKGKKTYDIEAMRAAGIPVDDFTKISGGHDRVTIREKGPRVSGDEG